MIINCFVHPGSENIIRLDFSLLGIFNNLDVHAVLIAMHCVTNMHSDISHRTELLKLNIRINVSI